MSERIRILQSRDGRHRVAIFRRASGTYGFSPERWASAEEAWVPDGRYSEAVIGSADEAEAESRAWVEWLQAESEPSSLERSDE
jgi:hypothetical protein